VKEKNIRSSLCLIIFHIALKNQGTSNWNPWKRFKITLR